MKKIIITIIIINMKKNIIIIYYYYYYLLIIMVVVICDDDPTLVLDTTTALLGSGQRYRRSLVRKEWPKISAKLSTKGSIQCSSGASFPPYFASFSLPRTHVRKLTMFPRRVVIQMMEKVKISRG